MTKIDRIEANTRNITGAAHAPVKPWWLPEAAG
jgi:hypothetical protein